MLKKLLVCLLSGAFVVTSVYADTTKSSPSAGTIEGAIANVITAGQQVNNLDHTKRMQAAVMLLRLRGMEAEAMMFNGKQNFLDAEMAGADGKKILAYLKANPNLGWVGYPNGNFGVNDWLTAQQYYKVLLTTLGYTCNVDFSYEDSIKFATAKGLPVLAVANGAWVTNGEFVSTAVATAQIKGPNGQSLLDQLVAKNLIALPPAAVTAPIDPVPGPVLATTSPSRGDRDHGGSSLGVQAQYAALDSLIQAPYADRVDMIRISSKEGILFSNVNMDRISLVDLLHGGVVVPVQIDHAASGISSDKTRINLKLMQNITSDQYTLGKDAKLGLLFANDALTTYYLSEATQIKVSQAMSTPFQLVDKCLPSVQKINAKADSGTGQDTIILRCDEPIAIESSLIASDLIVKDLDVQNGLILTPATDYTVAVVDGVLEIKVIKSGISNHRFAVGLSSGNSIHDTSASANYLGVFTPVDIFKADGVTTGGAITVTPLG